MSCAAPNDGAPLLRLAEAADSPMIFAWRNDEWIVSLSTSRRTVTWEEHTAWFASVLNRSRHLLFIIYSDENIPAGTVRLDKSSEQEATLTIYLLQTFTGRGLGPRAIDAACACAFDSWLDLTRITAFVRADNQPSLKAFTRSGFHSAIEEELLCPAGHVALVRRRDGS